MNTNNKTIAELRAALEAQKAERLRREEQARRDEEAAEARIAEVLR